MECMYILAKHLIWNLTGFKSLCIFVACIVVIVSKCGCQFDKNNYQAAIIQMFNMLWTHHTTICNSTLTVIVPFILTKTAKAPVQV